VIHMGFGTATIESDVNCMAFVGYEVYEREQYVRCGAFGILPIDVCKTCVEFRNATSPDYYR
jgi:hypothetical protein